MRSTSDVAITRQARRQKKVRRLDQEREILAAAFFANALGACTEFGVSHAELHLGHNVRVGGAASASSG